MDDNRITLKHARQLPVARKRLGKQQISLNLEFRNEFRVQCDELIPRLLEKRYSKMAEFLEWAKLEPNSNACKIGVRAANLILHGQRDSARFWMKLVNGLDVFDEPEDSGMHFHSQRHIFTESVEGWDK